VLRSLRQIGKLVEIHLQRRKTKLQTAKHVNIRKYGVILEKKRRILLLLSSSYFGSETLYLFIVDVTKINLEIFMTLQVSSPLTTKECLLQWAPGDRMYSHSSTRRCQVSMNIPAPKTEALHRCPKRNIATFSKLAPSKSIN
jgi:hypothetical protein